MDNRKEMTDSNPARKFKEAARELGCDEDEARFDATVKKVAKAKPKGESKSEK